MVSKKYHNLSAIISNAPTVVALKQLIYSIKKIIMK